jgi:hypothetical protein
LEDIAFLRTIALLEDLRSAFMSHPELSNPPNEWCKKWLIDCQFCAYENAYHSFFFGRRIPLASAKAGAGFIVECLSGWTLSSKRLSHPSAFSVRMVGLTRFQGGMSHEVQVVSEIFSTDLSFIRFAMLLCIGFSG